MSDSMRQRVSSAPVHSLDDIRPTPLKVTSTSPARSVRPLGTVIKEALVDHFGKLEVAATEMGQMDPSQFSRDAQHGTLKTGRVDTLDPAAKAAIADALQSEWGGSDPKDLIRREIREARSRLNRIEELITRAD